MGDVLFLAHRVPFPPNRGDKIRAFHILQHLNARARVHLVALADDVAEAGQGDALAGLTASRHVFARTRSKAIAGLEALATGAPVSVAAFRHAGVAAAVRRVLAGHPVSTIYVFSSQMAQFVPPDTHARVIMDFVDMDAAKFAQYAQTARGPMRWLNAREGRVLLRHDAAVATRADAGVFVSAEEAALFRAGTGAANIHVVENGIDTAAFDPDAAFAEVKAQQPLIVFTGQMDYAPNAEAVRWFAEAVLPAVQARHPGARFAVVGRKPTEAVSALARLPGVEVTGEVADVRGWLAAARVVVAPLKLARGVQNKVLEAMAMARPVVATSPAAEGIDHAGTLRIADDAVDYAAAVCTLLDDRDAAEAEGAAARAHVIRRYAWPARLAALDPLLGWEPQAVAA